MEYCVVRHEETGKLVEAVNKLIKEGWEPQGGIAIKAWNLDARYGKYEAYYQAMIKRK